MRNLLLIFIFFLISCYNDPSIIHISRQYHLPTVTVYINGKSVQMILDTGGAITVIDDNLLTQLNIKMVEGEKNITGYGGTKKLSLTNQREITLGKTELYGDIYVTDLQYLTKETPIGGIIGIDHISSGHMVIDLSKNIIEVK